MGDWLSRFAARQIDLARGVDSTLVQANRRRYKLAWLLLAVSFLSMLIGVANLTGWVGWILKMLTFIVFLCGSVLLHWASQERGSLNKPDPKKLPSIIDGE
jgi:hypothetical protein